VNQIFQRETHGHLRGQREKITEKHYWKFRDFRVDFRVFRVKILISHKGTKSTKNFPFGITYFTIDMRILLIITCLAKDKD